jgi:hypothetical protein
VRYRAAPFPLFSVLSVLSVFGVLSCKARRVESTAQATDQIQASTVVAPYHRFGIRPDCTERPLSFEALKAAAAQATDQQDFLNRLPKDALQTYTLVFESNSAQADGISAEYPGVIRMTANGKLVIRYTCDPDSPVYGTIETMRFDDTEKKFLFEQIDYRAKKEESSCGDCHTMSDPQDLRPNWTNYDTWPGIYGSRDDFFPPASADEKKNFDAFLAKHKQDPCYQSLSWPKDPDAPAATPDRVPAEYQNYPYGTQNRSRSYQFRPNLKFTEVLVHLLGQRNFRKLSQSPGYERTKRWLAVEAAYCEYPDLQKKLQAALPAIRYPTAAEIDPPVFPNYPNLKLTSQEPRHPDSKGVGLFSTSLALGFVPGDWTLTYDEPKKSGYATGLSPGQSNRILQGSQPFDLPPTALVQMQILKDVTSTIPSLRGFAPTVSASRGESAAFGAQFACIDDLGGGPVFTSEADRKRLCDALIAEAEANDGSGAQTPPGTGGAPSTPGAALRSGIYRRGADQTEVTIRVTAAGTRATSIDLIFSSRSTAYKCDASNVCRYDSVLGESTIRPDGPTSFTYSRQPGDPGSKFDFQRPE